MKWNTMSQNIIQEAQTLDLPVFHSWMSQNHFSENTSFALSSLNTKTSILNKAFKYIDKSFSGSCSLFPLDPLALCLHWHKKNSKKAKGTRKESEEQSNRRRDRTGIFSEGQGESYILPLNFVSHGRVLSSGWCDLIGNNKITPTAVLFYGEQMVGGKNGSGKLLK